jgi:hypothetical protein
LLIWLVPSLVSHTLRSVIFIKEKSALDRLLQIPTYSRVAASWRICHGSTPLLCKESSIISDSASLYSEELRLQAAFFALTLLANEKRKGEGKKD